VLKTQICVTRLQCVKAMRYKSEGSGIDPRSLGIFSGASDSFMCPGVDSASKNEYQDIPGSKDGRCVRVTTLPVGQTTTNNAATTTLQGKTKGC